MSDNTIILNRQQLAEFLPNQQAIIAFEQLFQQVQITLPDASDSNQILSAQAIQQASEALSSLAYIADQLSKLLLAPVKDSLLFDVDFNNSQEILFPELFIPPVFLGTASNKNYEIQKFLPTLTFGGAAVGMTYATQEGYAVKFGEIVFFTCNFRLTAKGASIGAAIVNGLPWTSRNVVDGETAISVYANAMAAAATTSIVAFVTNNANTISPARFTAGATTALADTDFGNASVMRISGIYFTPP